MILTEYLNEGTLIKHYSDSGFMLLQNETGAKYAEPIDLVPCQYTYSETDESIEEPEEMSEDIGEITEKAFAYDIIVGEEE